jgi:hypothetical protein
MATSRLTMFETSGGRRYLYDGEMGDSQGGSYDFPPERLYVFDQMVTPQGEIVSKPVRFDNTPFASDGPVHLVRIESWWYLDPKSELSRKFADLKMVNSAKKANLVLG